MKSLWFGVISAVAVLVMLLKFLSGAASNSSFLESLSTVEAVKNLAFALGFGAGLPTTVALIAAVCVVALIPVATFLLVRRFTRRLDKGSRA
jgi:uncharacterized membrane protein YhaH (DUF805 family)